MNLKLTLSILVCGALLAALSCGKGNPLKPLDNEPADTTGLDSTGLKTPKLIPLASGASWKYSIIYRIHIPSFSLSPGWDSYENHYGLYLLRAISADSGGGGFELEGKFTLDSLEYFWVGYNIDLGAWDSTGYKKYAGIDTTLTDYNTTSTWHVVTRRDTLWYDYGDSLVYFMPWQFSEDDYDVLVEPRIFNYPEESTFQNYLLGRYGLKGTDSVGNKIYAFSGSQYAALGLSFELRFDPERGGMISLIAFNSPSHLTPDKRLEYKLLEFVPGGSVSH